jgi:two-component system, OmpR family, sensor kinase
MTPIVGRVQRLRRMTRMPDFCPETLEKSLEQIEWLIARFVKRATTLLDVSRVITGKFRLELARTDVGGLVREVAENFGPILDHAGSSLAVNVPDRDIIRVCDRLALEQILDNLISNAIKYGAGQPILVSALEDTASGQVVVQVQDRGLGISPEGQA